MNATSPNRSRGWLLLQLIAGLSFAGALLAVMRWMASEVFEGETDAFDQAIRNGIHSIASAPLTDLFIAISFVGSPAFITVIGVLLVGGLIYFGLKREALLIVITMVGEIILDVSLKDIYTRVRPEPFFNYALPTSFSFPSGHALGSTCFYGMIAWIIATRANSRAVRSVLPSTLAVLVLLIGISRVYLGVHYPTDVIAGFIAGIVWTATVCFGDRRILTPTPQN